MNLKVSFDLLTLEVFYNETKEIISNSIIEKIYQIGNTDIIWELYSPNFERCKLVLSVHPQLYRIQITKKDFPYPYRPPSFLMLLRKYLEGGRIIDYYLIPQERIVEFKIKRFPEEEKKVVLELMGKYSNLILLDENNKIIDAIKHVTSEVSRFREIIPGLPYIYPPKTQKISLLDLDEKKIEELLKKNISIKDFLLKEIAYMNPQIVKDILGDTNSDMIRKILSIKETILNKNFKPIVYMVNNEPITYTLFPLKEYERFEKKEFEKVYKAVDYIYSYAFDKSFFEQRRKKILKVVKDNIEKVTEKIKEFEVQIKEGEEAEMFKIKGETLLLNKENIKKGTEKVILPNIYNSQELLEIDLDPSLSPIENAQKYFKKYKKLKKGISILKEQKEKLENELYYLNSLDFAIENAKTLADLKEIEEELEKEGYLKKAKEQIIKREKKSEPYKFVSSDGFEIYVGKNNKQNETLTFQIAKTEDLWLHARGIPGAHVIIKTQGKEIPENTLYEASSLAAYFSKG
ncbi:MAG: NFACT family protein, partial [Caldimicrobium sp.]